jgi:xylulokinase
MVACIGAAIVRGGRVGNAGVATSGTHRARGVAHIPFVVVDARPSSSMPPPRPTRSAWTSVRRAPRRSSTTYRRRPSRARARAPTASCPNPKGVPHFAEQDPEDWLEGIRVAVKQALDDARCDPSAIASVGVSAQQHGMVALDANGDLVRPAKLWCDVESSSEAKELAGRFGWDIQAGFTSSKVLWMIRHEPNNWSRTAHVLLPHDWINYKLTGVLAMERGDASGIGVMDVNTREFDENLCNFVDPRFRSTLPDLVPPEGTIGVVTTEASRGWLAGLVPPGAEVSVGSGDNMMSALGAGCVIRR